MSQPNGEKVDIRLFGSEFYIRAEGLDGYTLVRDKKGWICYANLSKNGKEFISTGIRYGGKEGVPSSFKVLPGIPKHLELSPEAIDEISYRHALALSDGNLANLAVPGHPLAQGTPSYTVKGKIIGLAMVVDFSDAPRTLPISEYGRYLNDTTYNGFGNNGSLRSYYREVSGGLVDYENVVVGYYRAPETFAYYNSLPMGEGARQIMKWVLDSLENQGFDFSALTVNSDSTFEPYDNSIQAINLIYTGNPPNWAQGMWFHRGVFTGFTSSSGVKTFDYNTSSGNSPLNLGIIAHENGHMLGKWPDTYKRNSTTGPDGIGAFDLMCDYASASNPVPPNPLFRRNAGWGKYVDVSNRNALIRDTANSGIVYRYNNPSDTNEFFLFENRRKTGRSAAIPDAGLTIWHIDRNGNNQTRHHEVRLVTANNDSLSQSAACFRAFFKPEFSQTTNPKSSWYSGDPSGLRLWEVGPRSPIVTYKIGAGQPASAIKIKYLGISDTNNGIPEAGETIDVNAEISNTGQLASGNCSLTCSAIGVNSNLVTILSPIQTLGVLPVDTVLKRHFDIQISPLAQAGDEVTLRIQIQDGTQALSVTRTILLGYQINISGQNDSTCDALFYDSGGQDLYQNSSDFIQTVYPSGSGKKLRVQFLDFFLEPRPNCVNDYLTIYDGPGTDSPLMGTWCGLNSPGTLTSTDTTGALTFEFHSNEIFFYPGWKAKLSCVGITDLDEQIQGTGIPTVFPNPGNGVFYFSNPEKIKRLRVYNLLGKELPVTESLESLAKGIDLRHIPGQVFLFKVETDQGSGIRKAFKGE